MKTIDPLKFLVIIVQSSALKSMNPGAVTGMAALSDKNVTEN